MPQFTVQREYDLPFEDFEHIRSLQPYLSIIELANAIRSNSNPVPALWWPLKDAQQIAQQLRDEGIVIVGNSGEPNLLKRDRLGTRNDMAQRLVAFREEISMKLSIDQALVLVKSYIDQNALPDPEA